jgi:hypothetical protein
MNFNAFIYLGNSNPKAIGYKHYLLLCNIGCMNAEVVDIVCQNCLTLNLLHSRCETFQVFVLCDVRPGSVPIHTAEVVTLVIQPASCPDV